jgi:hypothetical protein
MKWMSFRAGFDAHGVEAVSRNPPVRLARRAETSRSVLLIIGDYQPQ